MAKTTEEKAKHLMNHLLDDIYPKGAFSYKFRDVSYCNVCHTAQPKNETQPDYLLALQWTYIEVKGPHKSWKFPHQEPISDTQREKLGLYGGYLFIELGEGNRPNGIQAFLVPWDGWRMAEKDMLERGQKSLPLNDTARGLKGATYYFNNLRLAWKPTYIDRLGNETKGHWIIPYQHVFWYAMLKQMEIFIEGFETWKNLQTEQST